VRIALICPHFPPDPCGVGDQTALLSSELNRQGHYPGVWTAQPAPNSTPGTEIYSHPGHWRTSVLRVIGDELHAWQPDGVLIQYTPYLYSRKPWDIPVMLPLWISSLKNKLQCPILLDTHELHYPLGFTLDRIFVGLPQFALFQALVFAPDHVFFSYEVPSRLYARTYPWRKDRFSWLPVGASIDSTHINNQNLLQKLGIEEKHRILLQFGSSHPARLFSHTFGALDAASRHFGPDLLRLIFVGIDEKSVEAQLAENGRQDLKPFVQALGYLPNQQVSTLLRRSDVILAPFIDGISTRRSSVMAALSHGCPVVTTKNFHTDPSVHWEEFCAVAEATDSTRFAMLTVELLKDHKRAKKLGAAAKQKYDQFFSWPLIAQTIVSRIQTL
jgi:glycosyltransferase involved in cell wall biosynthesis